MTHPLPQPARAASSNQAMQCAQNAAAVSPSPAAASPIKQVGVFALAAIAHIPVPKVVKQ